LSHDRVAGALVATLEAWARGRDRKSLRRALLDLLRELENDV